MWSTGTQDQLELRGWWGEGGAETCPLWPGSACRRAEAGRRGKLLLVPAGCVLLPHGRPSENPPPQTAPPSPSGSTEHKHAHITWRGHTVLVGGLKFTDREQQHLDGPDEDAGQAAIKDQVEQKDLNCKESRQNRCYDAVTCSERPSNLPRDRTCLPPPSPPPTCACRALASALTSMTGKGRGRGRGHRLHCGVPVRGGWG